MEVYTFPKGIRLKVNVITHMEFELASFEIIAQHFKHYASETPVCLEIELTIML